MHPIDYETEEPLFDNQYYSEAYSRYEAKRNKDLEHCDHHKWSKHCAICNRIVSSEMTDQDYLDYLKLKRDYDRLETVVIRLIYG
jgi:hypothetical protein